jgi:hypothetical protein
MEQLEFNFITECKNRKILKYHVSPQMRKHIYSHCIYMLSECNSERRLFNEPTYQNLFRYARNNPNCVEQWIEDYLESFEG